MPTAPADDVPHADLAAALLDPNSYPRNLPALVTLTNATRTGIWNAPEQGFALVQKIAPFETQIDRLGRTPLAAPITIHVDSVALAGVAQTRQVLTSEFRAGCLSLARHRRGHSRPGGRAVAGGIRRGRRCRGRRRRHECDRGVRRDHDRSRAARTVSASRPAVARHARGGLARDAAATSAATHPHPAHRCGSRSQVGAASTTFADAWAARGSLLRRTEGVG